MVLSHLLTKAKQRLEPVLVATLQAKRASEIKQHVVAGIIHALVIGGCFWFDTFYPLLLISTAIIGFHYETYKEIEKVKKSLNLVMNNQYDFIWNVVRIEPELKKLNTQEIQELFSLPLNSEQLETLRKNIQQEGFITYDVVAVLWDSEHLQQQRQKCVQEEDEKLKDFLREYEVPFANSLANNKSFNSKHVL